MANMNYCRFENTYTDLQDCYESINDKDNLNEDEIKARRNLINLCKDIANEFKNYEEDEY